MGSRESGAIRQYLRYALGRRASMDDCLTDCLVGRLTNKLAWLRLGDTELTQASVYILAAFSQVLKADNIKKSAHKDTYLTCTLEPLLDYETWMRKLGSAIIAVQVGRYLDLGAVSNVAMSIARGAPHIGWRCLITAA